MTPVFNITDLALKDHRSCDHTSLIFEPKITDVVGACLRSFGITSAEVSPRGVATLLFENDFHVQILPTADALFLTLSAPFGDTLPDLRRLLLSASPMRCGNAPLHATLHPEEKRALWTTSLPIAEVNLAHLHAQFMRLWYHAERTLSEA